MEDKKEKSAPPGEPAQGTQGFFGKYAPQLVLGALVLYVILLATGTIAEMFNIQPILDWWIWRP